MARDVVPWNHQYDSVSINAAVESRINMGCVCCKRTKFVESCKMKGVELGAIVGELRKSSEVMDDVPLHVSDGEESSETDSSSSICSSFADDEEDDNDDDNDDDDGEIERITSLRIDHRRPSIETDPGLAILHDDIFYSVSSTFENNEEGIDMLFDDEDAHFVPGITR